MIVRIGFDEILMLFLFATGKQSSGPSVPTYETVWHGDYADYRTA